MKGLGLISKYTVAQFKPTKSKVIKSKFGHVLNRAFNQDKELKVIVSDLIYVHVGVKLV